MHVIQFIKNWSIVSNADLNIFHFFDFLFLNMTKFLNFLKIYFCLFLSVAFAQETRVREFEFGKIQIGHASASIRAFHLRNRMSEFQGPFRTGINGPLSKNRISTATYET